MNCNTTSTRGGVRPGSGRPTTDRKAQINARVSPEAKAIYDSWPNKSERLDEIIKIHDTLNILVDTPGACEEPQHRTETQNYPAPVLLPGKSRGGSSH